MDLRIPAAALAAVLLLACGLGSVAEQSRATPTSAVAPTIAAVSAPPTQVPGGSEIPFNTSIPNTRLGESGGSCGALAADLQDQKIDGTLTVFPNAGPDQFHALTQDSHYTGQAVMLNGDCQPSGAQYDLTAYLSADYSATLGTAGQARCIRDSQLTLTSFQLQGLPGPLNAIAGSIVQNSVPRLIQPRIDEFIARRLNGGTLPSTGARCPG